MIIDYDVVFGHENWDLKARVKEKLAERMANMSLKEQKEFMHQVREGEIKIS